MTSPAAQRIFVGRLALLVLFLVLQPASCVKPQLGKGQSGKMDHRDELLNSMMSFQQAVRHRIAALPLTQDEKEAEAKLVSKLDRLRCGIPTAMATAQHLTVVKCDSMTVGETNDWEGSIFLAELSTGNVLTIVTQPRPNRTSIFTMGRDYRCTLLFDSFRFAPQLEALHTTMEYIGQVSCIGKDSFILSELWNPTMEEITSYPRRFLLQVTEPQAQIRLLGYLRPSGFVGEITIP